MTPEISSVHKNTLFRAKSAVLSRDFDLATRLFKRVLKEHPDSIEVMHELASAYVRSGQDGQALLVCQQILEKDRNDFGALVSLGGIYRRLGRYEESVSVLERALALDENSVQTYYNLGFTYKQMGRYDDALECFNNVIEDDPTDILAYNHLGRIYSLRDDSKNAISSYRRGLQLDANHPILHYNLAYEYEKLGRDDEVQTEYEAALRAKPGWSEAINSYAHFLMSHNRYKEAYEILSQGIQVTPENMSLHQAMGMVQLKRGEYGDAGQRFRTVLEYDSDDSMAMMGLADVYVYEGREIEASNLLEKVESMPLRSKGERMQYARSLLNANKFDSAGALIKGLLDEYDYDLATVHLVAEYYACCNDMARLDQSLDRINSLDSSYFLHFLDIALRFRQIGNFERTQVYLVEYLKHLPNDPVALAALASCYEQCNQYGDAMRFYQQALNKDSQNSMLQGALERISRVSELGFQESQLTKPASIPPVVTPSLMERVDDYPTLEQEEVRQDSYVEELYVSSEPEPVMPILELDSSTKSKGMDHYDPLVIHSDEPDNNMDIPLPGLSALAHDDGPVDYEPLNAFNAPLSFHDEEEAIFDNVDQIPEEYFLQEMPRQPLSDKAHRASQERVLPELPGHEEPPAERELMADDFEIAPEPPRTELERPKDREPSEDELAMPWDFDGDPSDLEPEPEPEELEAVPDDSFDDVEELVPLDGPELLAEQKLPPLQNKPLQFKPVEKAEEAVEELVPQGILLEINRLLENKELLEKHGDLVGLFHEMKRLCEFLPKEKREGFHAGMKRMQMDYIISKLSGKPGLMTVAESLRDKGLVSVPDEKYDIVERFDEPAVSARVIGLMRPLVQQLPDKNDALSLDGSLRNVLERLAAL
ncbi:MAG: tetratricopeptide repeat protein [Spirochaetaceae bacterium]|nr:tetratricopeptide repeat protein [Spirochaetaceae bacterium]